ncbi:MAG: ABC transporter permease [Armatimonadetes bacterium]|nr:ABC transporter permease [Armatimonadota bacterium]
MSDRRPVSKLVWPALALATVLAFNALSSPGFFHVELRDGHLFGTLINILNRAAPVMLVSLGMTLVLATRGVDLSVGAVMAIAGAVAADLVVWGAGLPGVVAAARGAALVAGLFNGLLVARFDIQPIVATLILMVAGRGVAQLLTGGQIVTFENRAFEFIGGGFWLGLPFPVMLTGLTLGGLAALSGCSALRLFIEAVGGNATASRGAGVPVARVKLAVYGLSGVCAGVAGLIATSDIKGADANNAGLYLELDAILAAVIGGTSLNGGRFSLIGALLGALVIQAVTTTILTRNVPAELTLVVKALVVVVVFLLQSEPFRRRLAGRGGGGR